MTIEQIKGAADKVAGKVQDAAGALGGDAGTQVEGKLRQVAGSVRESAGEAVDKVRSQTAERPMGALLLAAGIGFLLGAMMVRRGD